MFEKYGDDGGRYKNTHRNRPRRQLRLRERQRPRPPHRINTVRPLRLPYNDSVIGDDNDNDDEEVDKNKGDVNKELIDECVKLPQCNNLQFLSLNDLLCTVDVSSLINYNNNNNSNSKNDKKQNKNSNKNGIFKSKNGKKNKNKNKNKHDNDDNNSVDSIDDNNNDT